MSEYHGLIFDKKRHIYTDLLGEVYLSNTELLEAFGFSDYSFVPPDKLALAAEIGKDVHEATALLDIGRPWKRKYVHVAGYVKGWVKFKKDFKFKPKIIEQSLCDPTYRVATTPDRYGHSIHGSITVQIKTGIVDAWVGLQTAFEERCIGLTYGVAQAYSTPNRFGIELRSDGTYKPRRFDRPGYENDIGVFLAAVSVYQWMKAHNKIPKKVR